MPITASPGLVTTFAQTTGYALPACTVWIVSSAALQFSLDNSNWTSNVAASTTGMESAYPFVRCTGSTALVSVKKT